MVGFQLCLAKHFFVLLEFYFDNIKLFWPYDLYKFSEDLALSYLMRKNYDIELALAMIGKCQ